MRGFSGFKNSPAKQVGPRNEKGDFVQIQNKDAAGPGPEITTTVSGKLPEGVYIGKDGELKNKQGYNYKLSDAQIEDFKNIEKNFTKLKATSPAKQDKDAEGILDTYDNPPKSPAKQKTHEEESDSLQQTQQAFIRDMNNKNQATLDSTIAALDKKGQHSVDSIHNVNKNYKTQEQKDYENLSTSAYCKKYPKSCK